MDGRRRTHILEVAERLLRHYGPQKTTIAEIARAAEVGVGTVYLEFDSKEAIVEELSGLRHRAVLDAMRQALDVERPFGDRLRAMFDARLFAFLRLADEGHHARDLVHCVSPAVRSAQARFKEAELELVRELLSHADDAAEFACAARQCDELASAVLMAYASFAPPFVFGEERDALTRRQSAMHHLVLYGLMRRDLPARTPSASRSTRRR